MSIIEKYTINRHEKIIEAIKKINSVTILTLFVIDEEGKIVGTLTDGDVRRGFINGLTLEDETANFMLKSFKFLKTSENDTLRRIVEARKANVKLLPLIDDNNNICDIIDLTKQKTILPVDAVLMAGGRGERLRPLTDETPKPLLKLGDKAIIEYNIHALSKFGISNVFISVKYLADKIITYLGNGDKYGLHINYLKESQPLGTLGSVSLVGQFKSDTVLVMNSDLFTNLDLEEFYLHFLESGADMAVASFPYVVAVPYGVLNTEEDSTVHSFSEKPTYTYHASAGMYLIKRSAIDLVPKDSFYNATDLMDLLISQNKKITYFPIVGYWIDIGKPDDYKKAQEYVKYLNV
jgi:dTDP-glucose pyrophosphorylase